MKNEGLPSISNSSTPVYAITGGASFIGRHLVRHLLTFPDIEIRLLIHHHRLDLPEEYPGLKLITGDLREPETLEGFLQPDCAVINLAFIGGASEQYNLEAISNLADACRKADIRRMVHCSTAVVAGRVSDDVITEETECKPDHGYELTKFRMEKLITEKARGQFDLAVLRPTAVFGPGGKNLLKLANDLSSGNRILNYLKSCLFDRRRMNLVSVDHVVAALIFLSSAEQKMEGDIYIVSDDDHPLNNYRGVEQYLIRALGCRDYSLPRIPLPSALLATVLRLAGRSNSNPSRIYHMGNLMDAGFEKKGSFEGGLALFAEWYGKQRMHFEAAGYHT